MLTQASVAEQPSSALVPDAAALPFNEGDEGLLNFEDDQVAVLLHSLFPLNPAKLLLDASGYTQ